MADVDNEVTRFSGEIEGWGHIRVPGSIPKPWAGLIIGFSSVLSQMLSPEIREGSSLCVVTIYDRLHFSVETPENLGSAFEDAIRTIASAFSDLSAYAAQDPAIDFGFATAQKMRVFSLDVAHKFKSQARGGDTSKRIAATMEQIRVSGQFRPLQVPPVDWEERVQKLAADFPNFADVVRLIVEPHLSIISCGGRHRQPPILLVGAPGVGKTHFANALARVLGLKSAVFVGMAEETNGSSLAGSSSFWENAAPGRLFEALAWGESDSPAVADPLVLVDEIDKAQGGKYDPIAALYSLLESDTASKFKDQSLPDITLDVSRVRFVFTANRADKIPEPLLSRMVVFHIPQPSKDQLRSVVRNMFRTIASAIGLEFRATLPQAVLEASLQLSPREARVRLECSIASAVRAGRKYVTLRDWPDLQTAAQQRKRIGFTP